MHQCIGLLCDSNVLYKLNKRYSHTYGEKHIALNIGFSCSTQKHTCDIKNNTYCALILTNVYTLHKLQYTHLS